MAKKPKDIPAPPAPLETQAKPKSYLPWPAHPSDLAAIPRKFRIHRLDSFAWQAYISDEDGEHAIGKPDVFDILCDKVKGIMRLEGQAEFLKKRTEDAKKTHLNEK